MANRSLQCRCVFFHAPPRHRLALLIHRCPTSNDLVSQEELCLRQSPTGNTDVPHVNESDSGKEDTDIRSYSGRGGTWLARCTSPSAIASNSADLQGSNRKQWLRCAKPENHNALRLLKSEPGGPQATHPQTTRAQDGACGAGSEKKQVLESHKTWLVSPRTKLYALLDLQARFGGVQVYGEQAIRTK